MRIIAYRTSTQGNKVLLEESTGEHCLSNKLDELLSFLLEQYDNTIRVCFSLDGTVAPLLKLLGKEKCLRLHNANKCYLAPFNLFYAPGKVLQITHIPSKNKASLYELEQYFPGLNNNRSIEEIEYLGLTLIKALKEMGLVPSKLTSPVAIYEQCVFNHLNLPTVEDMPKEATEYAYQCSGRLWIECHQIGYFK